MNLTMSEQNKVLFWIIGFIVPLLFVAFRILFSVGSAPLMILALAWFGIALLIYLGVYEEG